MPEFLGIERLSLGPWQAFERALQRLLIHAGFDDVRLVGGTGDAGADVVGELRGQVWVVQAKFRGTGQLLGTEPVKEVTVALERYGGSVGLVAVNTGYTADAVAAATKQERESGLRILLWNRDDIAARIGALGAYPEHRSDPRRYQADAIEAISTRIMEGARTGFLLMATGLGKTRVAATIIEQWIDDHPHSEVLMLAPTLSLVPQLEASLWPYLPRTVATHVLTGAEKPAFEGGVTVATYQSMIRVGSEVRGRYGLVIVDEAHHAPADAYRVLLRNLEPAFLLGMTATPWRSDERQLADIFGSPTWSVSIVEGMKLGYLAEVDYRMLVDNLDWQWIEDNIGGAVSIRELNRRLFVPERDEAVIAKIRSHIVELGETRCIVFCRSIEHAETVSTLLRADGIPARTFHHQLDRFDRTRALHDFRSGSLPVIVAVDMLNEGIDIPEVNLIVFLRVTHSRRIFLQQLGRGLRIAPGKSTVRVLDFVSDIRRVAAAIELNREAAARANADTTPMLYRAGRIVQFNNDRAASFFDAYLRDVAELEDASDDAQLKFPDIR